jgi:hypothetical protein
MLLNITVFCTITFVLPIKLTQKLKSNYFFRFYLYVFDGISTADTFNIVTLKCFYEKPNFISSSTFEVIIFFAFCTFLGSLGPFIN